MRALRDLQTDMAGAIRAAVTSEHLAPRALPALRTPERLSLHVRNFRAGLTGVLASIFPATARLVGDGFFAYAAAQFMAAHPPRDPVLAHYGEAFPGWLAAQSQLARLPFVADAARLEWMLHILADRHPAAPIDLSSVSDAADATFTLADGAALFAATSPASDLLDPDADSAALDMRAPCYLLLAAAPAGVLRIALSVREHSFLGMLSRGAPLSAALAADPDILAGPLLRRAAERGAFAAIKPLKDPAS